MSTLTMSKAAPSKAETAHLAVFTGLTLAQIEVPATRAQFEAAAAEILAAGTVGFDTESKPTFAPGEVSSGPHVVQFALPERAFIFQVRHAEGRDLLIELLQSHSLRKVGFGLGSDRSQVQAKFGVALGAVIDLGNEFRQRGYRNAVGVRAAVAIVFDRRFVKSKRTTTSNWALPQLNASQLLYAANDAFAALRVFQALHPMV
jgi:ribonuclease D